MWTGYVPNLLRNSIISAVELATFDQVKESLLKLGFGNDWKTQLGAGLTAGLAATLIGSPVDVIKVRLLVADLGSHHLTDDLVVDSGYERTNG